MMTPLKIFGWANDHNGCGNYRMGLPMWALGQLGHDTTAFSVLNVEIPADLDILVGQLIMAEDRSDTWQALARRADRSFGMIYEIDDDVWNVDLANPVARQYGPEVLARAESNIRVADAVSVTTNRLAETVARFNPNVVVLPNCFDGSILSYDRPRRERLTVGWAGGSSHAADFAFVRNDLRSFFKKNPSVDTHFIGMNYGAAIGRPDTRYTPWVANLVDYIRGLDFDLGIAPLAFNAFNRAKSDLKFLEYASLGIPVVASDFGPYSESVQHGVTGLLVHHPHEWGRHLFSLTRDADLRAHIGENARAWAATRSIQANIWRWDAAYRAVRGVKAEAVGALR